MYLLLIDFDKHFPILALVPSLLQPALLHLHVHTASLSLSHLVSTFWSVVSVAFSS